MLDSSEYNSIKIAVDVLEKVQQDVPVSDGNRASALAIEKALKSLKPLLERSLNPSQMQEAGSDETTQSDDLPTKLPDVAPIKWANRKKFVVSEIQDEFTRNRLEKNPDLEQAIRNSESACDFYGLVWKPFRDAELLYRVDLVGQSRTATNQTPKLALDASLAQLMWEECKGKKDILNNLLPKISVKVDREISKFDSTKFKELSKTKMAFYRRS